MGMEDLDGVRASPLGAGGAGTGEQVDFPEPPQLKARKGRG
jgi:hypothetical protein